MSQTYLYLEQRVSDNLSSFLWGGEKCPLIMKCLCYENTSIFKRSAVLPLIQDRFHPSLGKHCLPKSVQRLIASSERSSARAFFLTMDSSPPASSATNLQVNWTGTRFSSFSLSAFDHIPFDLKNFVDLPSLRAQIEQTETIWLSR